MNDRIEIENELDAKGCVIVLKKYFRYPRILIFILIIELCLVALGLLPVLSNQQPDLHSIWMEMINIILIWLFGRFVMLHILKYIFLWKLTKTRITYLENRILLRENEVHEYRNPIFSDNFLFFIIPTKIGFFFHQ